MSEIDDDAGTLYAEHGISLELAPSHPFVQAELARWRRSAELGRAFIAAEGDGSPLGFAALDLADGQPLLEQLGVRRAAMRRGIGARLLEQSLAWGRDVGGTELWLTTYAHLPFNRPFYERHGYAAVSDAECGPSIRQQLDEQRLVLPCPVQRTAMRRKL
jgi:GNAT superfamily N-acetyltransferase